MVKISSNIGHNGRQQAIFVAQLLLFAGLLTGCVPLMIGEARLAPLQTDLSTANMATCNLPDGAVGTQLYLNFTGPGTTRYLLNPQVRVFRNQIDGKEVELIQERDGENPPAGESRFYCDDSSCQVREPDGEKIAVGYRVEVAQTGYLSSSTTIRLATQNNCPIEQTLSITMQPSCSADQHHGVIPFSFTNAATGRSIENPVVNYQEAGDEQWQTATCVPNFSYNSRYFCEITTAPTNAKTVAVPLQISGDLVLPIEHEITLAMNEQNCLYLPAEDEQTIELPDACGSGSLYLLTLVDLEGKPVYKPGKLFIAPVGKSAGFFSAASYEPVTSVCVDQDEVGNCAQYSLSIRSAANYDVMLQGIDGQLVAARQILVPSGEHSCAAAIAENSFNMLVVDAAEKATTALLTNKSAKCNAAQQAVSTTLRLLLAPDQANLPLTLSYQIGSAAFSPPVSCTTAGTIAQCDFTLPYPFTENITTQIAVGTDTIRTTKLVDFDWFRCTDQGLEVMEEHSFSATAFDSGLNITGDGCAAICYVVENPEHFYFERHLDQQ